MLDLSLIIALNVFVVIGVVHLRHFFRSRTYAAGYGEMYVAYHRDPNNVPIELIVRGSSKENLSYYDKGRLAALLEIIETKEKLKEVQM